MGQRLIVGLITLAAVIEGVAPGAVPANVLPLLLVVLGLIWGAMGVDAEDPTTYLAVAIGVGLAGQSDALGNLPAIGNFLDGILDQASTALYSGVATVLALRTWNRVKGS
ncbi:hypothetical protein [Candidatus Foliamicus sp.]